MTLSKLLNLPDSYFLIFIFFNFFIKIFFDVDHF